MLCNCNNFYRISGWTDENRSMLVVKSERIDETIAIGVGPNAVNLSLFDLILNSWVIPAEAGIQFF